MGADLLLATLSIEEGQEPNWKRARGYVQLLMSPDDLEKALDYWLGEAPATDDGELDIATCRARLIDLVDEAEKIIEGADNRTYLGMRIVPGWMTYITGGTSWGDSPSEEFDIFNALHESGIAKMAGFS